jgi:hypothetical protein
MQAKTHNLHPVQAKTHNLHPIQCQTHNIHLVSAVFIRPKLIFASNLHIVQAKRIMLVVAKTHNLHPRHS